MAPFDVFDVFGGWFWPVLGGLAKKTFHKFLLYKMPKLLIIYV